MGVSGMVSVFVYGAVCFSSFSTAALACFIASSNSAFLLRPRSLHPPFFHTTSTHHTPPNTLLQTIPITGCALHLQHCQRQEVHLEALR